MKFEDIPSGASVFFDANVFVYDFGPDPQFGMPSQQLLERVELGDILGYCSTHELSDVAHRLMTLEACETFGWPYPGIGRRLRNNPTELSRLNGYRKALDEILAIGIRVLPVNEQHVLLAADLSQRHGLLSGDALIVAVMQANNMVVLASNDTDFDRVRNLTSYSPV
ncbi:MAG: type II toxin-antitoxin system VapC family toxin [Schlesneria sp.]